MTYYKRTYENKKYRQIYKNHYGSIPIDSDGRSYDIHHKDGNHANNDPSNLIAVPISEHYEIHRANLDWYACYMIALRMNVSPEKLTELAKLSAIQRVERGTHNMIGPDLQNSRVAAGTHPFLGGEIQRIYQREKVKQGHHHLLSSNKDSISNIEWYCEVCDKHGKTLGALKRWHGNCKGIK